MKMTIAVDAMGGDHGVGVTVPAVLRFLDEYEDVSIILVGIKEVIEAELKVHRQKPVSRLAIHHASEVIRMDELPRAATKNKKDASMRVAVNLVKSGQAHACISAGNTGALMAISRFVLKMIPGIERPAIAKLLPTIKGKTCVLDLGANVDCSALHLAQFGVMGSVWMEAIQHKENPSIGLLNIGSESIKGNEVVKQAGELLSHAQLNFYGNIEGDDIYRGTVDVVVSDGFSGNVALKTSEGLAKMLESFLREEFMAHWWSRLIALIAWPVLSRFKKRMDPRRYNGASLLGLRGIVVKSHGGADQTAFYWALRQAFEEIKSCVIQRITERVQTEAAGMVEISTDTMVY